MGFAFPGRALPQAIAETNSRSPDQRCTHSQETRMKRLIATLLAAVFTVGSVSAIACGDKAKDEKQMSTPSKPKI